MEIGYKVRRGRKLNGRKSKKEDEKNITMPETTFRTIHLILGPAWLVWMLISIKQHFFCKQITEFSFKFTIQSLARAKTSAVPTPPPSLHQLCI